MIRNFCISHAGYLITFVVGDLGKDDEHPSGAVVSEKLEGNEIRFAREAPASGIYAHEKGGTVPCIPIPIAITELYFRSATAFLTSSGIVSRHGMRF